MNLVTDFQELLVDIFRQSSSLSLEHYHRNDPKYRFISELRFPYLIDELLQPVESNNVSFIISKVLKSGYSFPFCYPMLENLPKLIDKSLEYSDYIEAYIYHSFISLMLLPYQLQGEKNVLTLLNNLLLVIEKSKSPLIAKKAFVHTIFVIYQNDLVVIPTAVIAQLNSFLLIYSDGVEKQCIQLAIFLSNFYFTSTKTYHSDVGVSLLSYLANLIKFDLQAQDSDILLASITPGMFLYPDISLEVYDVAERLLPTCTLSSHVDICKNIPAYVLQYICEENPDKTLDLNVYDVVSNEIVANFQPKLLEKTFEHDFDVVMPQNVNQEAFKIIIPPNIVKVQDIIIKGFAKSTDCVNTLLSSLLKEVKNRKSDSKSAILYQYFLQVSRRLYELNPRCLAIDFILMLDIFDPIFTFWTPHDNFDNISTLRSAAISFLVDKAPKYVYELVSNFSTYPLFMADILIRCTKMPKFLKIVPDCSISNVIDAIQQHCYKNPSKESYIARKVLKLYLEEITKTDEIVENLFQNVKFMNTLMNLIYENQMRSYILNFFNSFLNHSLDSINIFQTYGSIMAEILSGMNDPSFAQIYIDLTSNYIKIAGYLSGDIFLIYKTNIIENMKKFPALPHSKLCFYKSIEFFKACYRYPLTSEDADSILIAMNNIFVDNDYNTLFEKLLLYSTGYVKEQNEPKIVEPNTLRILVRFMFNTPLCHRILDYLTKMVKTSQENCIKCFEGGIDDYIINEANNYKAQEINDEILTKLKKILAIFSEIVLVKTCQKTVNKFIMLLTPIKSKDGTTFVKSPYYSLYFDTMNDIVNRNYKKNGPTIILGDNENSNKSFQNITGLNNGFSIVFWIRYDETQQYDHSIPIHVISLNDSISKKDLHVYMINKSLRILADGGETTVTNEIQGDVWTMISIRFLKNSNNKNYSLIISYNLEQIFHLHEYNFHDFHNSTALLFKPVQQAINCPLIELSHLYIATGTKLDTLNNLYESHCFPAYVSEKSVVLSFKASSIKQKIPQDSSTFPGILILWNLEPLLPLFTMVNFNNYDQHQDPNELKSVVRLFTMLLYEDGNQYNFTRNENIGKISYLLSQCSNTEFYLSFTLYLELYTLFKTVSNLELKNKIFRDILVYFPIWKTASPSEQEKIIEHWSNVLFVYDLNVAQIVCKFSYFFPMYNLTYPFDSDIPVTESLVKINDYIINICQKIALYNFTKNDFDLLFYYIYESENNDQILKFINLMSRIVDKSEKIKEIGLQPMDIVRFQLLINKQNSELFITTIMDIVINVHHKNIFSPQNLSWTAESFIVSLASRYITDEIFKYLSTNAMIFCDILPLCIWCSLCSDKNLEYQTQLIENLSNGAQFENISNPRLLTMWCCVFMAMSCNSELSYKMGVWALQVITFEELFITIDFVCKCLRKDSDELLSGFLKFYFQLLKKTPNMDFNMIIQFIEYSTVFLFMRTKNPKVFGLYDGSDFGIIKNESKKKKFADIKDTLNTDLLYKNLLVSNAKFGRNYAGIRLSEDKKLWIDAEFAFDIYFYILSSSLDIYRHFATLITYYLCYFDDEKRNIQPNLENRYFSDQKTFSLFKLLQNSIKENNKRTKYDILCRLTPLIEECYTTLAKKYIETNNIICNDIHKKVAEANDFVIKTAPRINSDQSQKKVSEISTLKQLRTDRENWRHLWHQLWSQLNAKCGPWDSNKKQFWKRSNKICECGCPVLMKINKHPVRHLAFHEFTKPVQQTNIEMIKIKVENKVLPRSENIIQDTKVSIIKIDKEVGAILRISKMRIEMETENKRIIQIDLNTILKVCLRNYLHNPTAIEIFTMTNSYFIDFGDNITVKRLQEIIDVISTNSRSINTIIKSEKFWEGFSQKNLTKKWVRGEISNYEYLQQINFASGRSYNDPSMYPIFPWVIAKYKDRLDMNDPSIFRDLTKPLGSIGTERFKLLLDEFYPECGFFYSSAHSSPLSLSVYHVRMEPFSTKQVDLQSGHFEDPNRQLRDLQDMYHNVTNAMNYTELSPEFFTMPEIFVNDNEFPLMPEIVLPWGCESPDHFVYLHRKILESNIVSEKLSDWIDLVWGYKQLGEEAVKAYNVYDPKLYYGYQGDRVELTTTRKQIGQVPPQLFNRPHPKRLKPDLPQLPPPVFGRLNVSDKVVMANFCGNKYDDAKFNCVLANGSFFSQNASNPLLVTEDKLQHISFFGNEAFTIYENHVYSIDLLTGKLTDYKIIVFNNVTVIKGSKNIIVLGYLDSTAQIIDRKTQRVTQLNLYRGSVTAADISPSFGVVAIATDDGVITIAESSTGTTIRNIQVNAKCSALCITKSWGFIVAATQDKSGSKSICVFTINGRFIRTREVQSNADMIETWTSPSGFDYCIIVLAGIVNVCEAFYLNFSPKFNKYSTHVCRVEYNERFRAVCTVREFGEYEVFPYAVD